MAIQGKAVAPGTILELPAGETRITVGKGPGYLPQTIVTNLADTNHTHLIEFTLEPLLNLYQDGWRAGDAHIHFFHGDSQVFRTPEEAYAICAAGGLNFASFAGEHFGAPTLTRDQAYRTWRAYENTDCKLWLGAEAPKSAWGHYASITYDPWALRDALPYNIGLHEVHRQGGITFPVHPERLFPFRSFENTYELFPLNNHAKYFPIAALAGHLLDGWSGLSDEPLNERALIAYDALLKSGHKIPFLADSDFCMDRINNGLKGVGFWVNYLDLRGQELTQAAVCTAIRQGRVVATTGPLVRFSIDLAGPGDILPADGQERTLRISASHHFNPWTLSTTNFAGSEPVRLELIELIRNGEVVRRWEQNSTTAEISEPLIEDEESYYMVRVYGNEGQWMVGYASPIYFSAPEGLQQRRPDVFKMTVNGRLYDAATGLALTGSVSSVRYGQVDWTIPTDELGRFRAKVPIDATLVARDPAGRELSRNILHHEPAYAFCHYIAEKWPNKAVALEVFRELVREVTWEFPIGLELSDAYVRMPLDRDVIIDDAVILAAPPPLPGKTSIEIVMMLVDKTQVSPGDTLNYTLIYRRPPAGSQNNAVSLATYAWDPRHPRMYTRYGTLLEPLQRTAPIDLGGGFFMRADRVRIPDWAANTADESGGIRVTAAIRQNHRTLEDANLILPVGPTERELLVNTTWDGFPATWGEHGHGPGQFFRETLHARYADNRQIELRLKIAGRRVRIAPLRDTATAPDADDALFTDQFYYDGQCEPEFRNLPFRAPVRPQPAPTAFDDLAIAGPPDTTPPVVALMEPFNGAEVISPAAFYFHVEDAGLSGAAGAELLLDGVPAATNSGTAAELPLRVNVAPGEHTWRVKAWDHAGNIALSEIRGIRVLEAPRPSDPPVLRPTLTGSELALSFSTETNRTYVLEKASSLDDWRLLLRTNASGPSLMVAEPVVGTNASAIYRLRTYP